MIVLRELTRTSLRNNCFKPQESEFGFLIGVDFGIEVSSFSGYESNVCPEMLKFSASGLELNRLDSVCCRNEFSTESAKFLET